MHFKLSIFFSLIISYCTSQTLVSSDTVELKSFRYANKQETIVVIDNDDQSLTFALTDNNNIYILKYDSVFKSIGKITIKKPSKKFGTLLGSSQDKDNTSFYFSDKGLSSLNAIRIDKKSLAISYQEFDLDFNNQEKISALTYHDKFYLVTGKNASSVLFLYAFDGNREPQKQEFKFLNELFNEEGKNKPLSTKLGLFGSNITYTPVYYLEENTPISIEVVASKAKIYCYNNTLTFSFDFLKNKTSFIEINLIDLAYKTKIIDNNLFGPTENNGVKSSNYLLKEKLFQIASKKDELLVRIINMDDLKILKELKATANKPIQFINSDFVRVDGLSLLTTDRLVSMDKQKAFFTKLHRSDVGILAIENSDTIELTIGGYAEKTYSYSSFHLSPMTTGFYSNTLSRSVYFKSKLKTDSLTHIEGEMCNSKIQVVQDFLKEYNVNNSNEVIFLNNGIYYVAYYVSVEKRFIIVAL